MSQSWVPFLLFSLFYHSEDTHQPQFAGKDKFKQAMFRAIFLAPSSAMELRRENPWEGCSDPGILPNSATASVYWRAFTFPEQPVCRFVNSSFYCILTCCSLHLPIATGLSCGVCVEIMVHAWLGYTVGCVGGSIVASLGPKFHIVKRNRISPPERRSELEIYCRVKICRKDKYNARMSHFIYPTGFNLAIQL